jgi:acyl-CoA thioester hydrolase
LNDTPPAKRSPAAPRLEDFPHHAADIIRLGDLDHQGHVNNAVYATYFETGRVNFMRDTFGGLYFGDRNFVVARVEINYLRELHWPGNVVAATGVEQIGGASVTYAQAVFHEGACAANGRTTMVLIDRATRRPIRIGDDMRAQLQAQMVGG